jgi:hypothetical protein
VLPSLNVSAKLPTGVTCTAFGLKGTAFQRRPRRANRHDGR